MWVVAIGALTWTLHRQTDLAGVRGTANRHLVFGTTDAIGVAFLAQFSRRGNSIVLAGRLIPHHRFRIDDTGGVDLVAHIATDVLPIFLFDETFVSGGGLRTAGSKGNLHAIQFGAGPATALGSQLRGE